MHYSYILRCAIQPGFHEDRKIEELVSFCKRAKIDDVMFFINCEELNDGHLTIEETKPWIELIAKAKPILDSFGVSTSINPWTSLLGVERGRKLKPGQDFQTMVDRHGNASAVQACPLCPEWQKYIASMYSYYSTLEPRMLWVEDDFRLHNHGPLDWGGCFCDLHMALYSKMAGRKLEREEFVNGMLKTGEPDQLRKIWLDSSRDAMVHAAGIIGDAVHRVSPNTLVGLMSSLPLVHCAEGRDWNGILSALSGTDLPMVNRPHMAAYREISGQDYLRDRLWMTLLSVTGLPEAPKNNQDAVPERSRRAATEIYPEVENFPHSVFSKSRKFTRFQIETTLAVGASGSALNIFDMVGNGVVTQDGFHEPLSEIKTYLQAVTDLGLSVHKMKGVSVLTSYKSSYTTHTYTGKNMAELYPAETFWAHLLPSFGISYRFCIDSIPGDGAVAVSGQYFRNLNSKQIEELFTNHFVVLDGDAVFVLYEMGMGSLAGITKASWLAQDTGLQAYEQVCDGRKYCGMDEMRISAQVFAGDLLNIEYAGPTVIKSEAKSASGETIAPGMAVHDGRVFILPYGSLWGEMTTESSQLGQDTLPYGSFAGRIRSHLNPLRQEVLQDVLASTLGEHCPAFVIDAPYVSAMTYVIPAKAGIHDLGYRTALLLINGSTDDYSNLKIHCPGVDTNDIKKIDRETGNMVECDAVQDGRELVLSDGIASLTTDVYVFKGASSLAE